MASTHQEDGGRKRLDYSKRNRKLEWRSSWFHLTRPADETELLRIREAGLHRKWDMIKKQRGTADHMAGYAPAGPGTPWFTIGPRNVNGRVKCLAVHPTNENIVYAGAASGGVWKSADGGQSWRPLWDQEESLAIGGLAIAPSIPDTIYAGTGEGVIAGTYGSGHNFPGSGVYLSNDAGASWTRRASVVNRRITRVLVSATDASRVYVAGQSGFERSTDAGITWATIRTGQASDAVIDPNNSDILYVCIHNDGIYKSSDGGNNWAKLTMGPAGASANWLKIAIGDSCTPTSIWRYSRPPIQISSMNATMVAYIVRQIKVRPGEKPVMAWSSPSSTTSARGKTSAPCSAAAHRIRAQT